MEIEQTLKETLLRLKVMNNEELKFEVSQSETRLISSLLKHIGTTDPELRDQLIYSMFIRLIAENMLNPLTLQSILETCLDNNHLFYRVGEIASDSVFTRSFSSLVIAAILENDKNKRYLSKSTLNGVFEKIQDYLNSEQDTRGYVEGKGWAHSIAHGADMLTSVVRHPIFTIEESKVALNSVEKCLFKKGIYTDDEDERLIFVIDALLDKKLAETDLKIWILHIFGKLEIIFQNEEYSLLFFQRKTNITNFMKTLYFRLGFKNSGSHVRGCIEDNLKIWHDKVYTSATD
ncbi:DUF2785 domain-containing protein [Planococcus halotolerans]|uniref:DUF2785 domain-containing protein n=1 Tax=Planococcus halotolerans TaxID=2233542 RepID=A0A365KJW5_9BACL|nr:DUF2785 domain-containing protein [Planococcus halotolerans]RAZ73442.1 hypothetical protein DP120_17065 [Planococcus halotolerans]